MKEYLILFNDEEDILTRPIKAKNFDDACNNFLTEYEYEFIDRYTDLGNDMKPSGETRITIYNIETEDSIEYFIYVDMNKNKITSSRRNITKDEMDKYTKVALDVYAPCLKKLGEILV